LKNTEPNNRSIDLKKKNKKQVKEDEKLKKTKETKKN